MMEFLLAAAILGFAAVFCRAVGFQSAQLGFVPANYKSYSTTTTMPGFTVAAAVNAFVFGVVLAGCFGATLQGWTPRRTERS